MTRGWNSGRKSGVGWRKRDSNALAFASLGLGDERERGALRFSTLSHPAALSLSLPLPDLPPPPQQQQKQQAWLDGRHAVVGTKCNQLLLLDVDARTGTKVRLPPAHERQPRPAGMDSPGHGVFNASGPKGSGMHTTAVSPDGRLLACGGSDATDAQIFRIERG